MKHYTDNREKALESTTGPLQWHEIS